MEILFAMEIMIQPSFSITSTSPDLQQVHRFRGGCEDPSLGFLLKHAHSKVSHELRGRVTPKARLWMKAELPDDSMKHTNRTPALGYQRTRHAVMKCWQHARHTDFLEWDTVLGVDSSDSERSRLLPAVRAAARPLPVADHCQCCKCSFGLQADWHARVARRHCGALPQVRGWAARNELLAL